MRILTSKKDLVKLHKVSQPIDITDTNHVRYIKEKLLETFNEYNGKMQGLSAIQIGLEYRVFLVRYKKGKEPIIIYNPNIHKTIGVHFSYEGCESEPGRRYYVLRPLVIFASYYDNTGKKHKVVIGRKKSRIFAHEYDHLNGILLADREVKL